VSARHAVARALGNPLITPFLSQPAHVIAVGKAAAAMATAFVAHPGVRVRTALAIGTHRATDLPTSVEWRESSHPLADERSVSAAARALDAARQVAPDECLVLLLSGGASALMASPIDGISLEQKQRVVHEMMQRGADIHTLNIVRKHLSTIKGGRLAAACAGTTLTLAISDVVGDDLAVIGSGPAVADPTTWADAAQALAEFAPGAGEATAIVRAGASGRLADTPKPSDPALARAHAFVIASRAHALDAAARAAEALGYRATVLSEDVTGEAREAAGQWFHRAQRASREAEGATCVLSAGETTVSVVGHGRGGRNQEFALALVDATAADGDDVIVASIGTDGIDGPTDAAGALVDATTRSRARELGLEPSTFLAHNNAYEFFANLGDLVHLGRTETNVGDVQIMLRRR
jgi:hydroxypyruvate reductase